MKKTTLKKCEAKLLEMKQDILTAIATRTKEALEQEENSTFTDENDAAQANSSKHVTKMLLEQNQQRLQMIEAALRRIKNGNYGICIDTEEEIDEARLLANPLALRTLDAQMDFEEEQKTMKTIKKSSSKNSDDAEVED